MPIVKFKQDSFTRQQYETVLDCLLRHQQRIPYACKAGMCQACLVKAVNHDATADSKKWVRKSLQDKGYTLACQWVPEGDIEVALPSVEEFSVPASIQSLTYLNPRVIRLQLHITEKQAMFRYDPGQYVTAINPEGVGRRYSIANDYEEDQFLELHIASTAHGLFTNWLFERARPSDRLYLRAPDGTCVYTAECDNNIPLLLVGTGTGLAPLYAILRAALRQGHTGPVTLIHVGRSLQQLYYVDQLQALQREHAQFTYRPCVREPDSASTIDGLLSAPLEEVVERYLGQVEPPRLRAFLCGAPDFVHQQKKALYLKGVRAANILTDPFIERTFAPA